MSESEVEMPTFVVPLQKSKILVPKASVAEIIPYEPLQQMPDTPDWFLGFLRWRGVQVPVASFEMLTVERASFSLVSVSSASLVILKVLGQQDDFAYMAIVAQQAPELVSITEKQLFETGEPVEKTELVKARFADQNIAIPDLDYIESEIRQVAFS
jgi:chemosensory pili system protein ChpC